MNFVIRRKAIMLKRLSFFLISLNFATTVIASCIEDASTCTPKQLCEVTTENVQGKVIWRNDSKLAQHIQLIKDFGLDCGEVASACEATPSECSISELCKVATLENNGRFEWNIDALDHLALVKEYGLTCNVATQNELLQTAVDNSINYKIFTKAEFAQLTSQQRRKVQFGLKKLGLYNSSIDGVWGKNTEAAIAIYVQQNNLSLDKPAELYERLESDGLFKGYRAARSELSINEASSLSTTLSSKGLVTCNLNDNHLFERNVRAYNYQARTDTLLNDVRQFTISNEIITMGYSKLSKRDDGTWRSVIKVICEMNNNDWSPCGSIYGAVIIKPEGNSYKGVLDIPYQWSTNGNVRIVNLQYSCTK